MPQFKHCIYCKLRIAEGIQDWKRTDLLDLFGDEFIPEHRKEYAHIKCVEHFSRQDELGEWRIWGYPSEKF